MNALDKITPLPEWIEKSILDQYSWPKFNEALIKIHSPIHPSDIKLTSPPRLRLAYDELLAKQVAIALVRNNNQKKVGIAHNSRGNYIDELLNEVEFEPTSSQYSVFEEIKKDMSSPNRMTRLLQGDVGSGKTFVAAMACAYAAESGSQVALMAPTEILARQHLVTLKSLLEPLGLTVEAITGRDKGIQRKALETGLKEGYIDVVIGTHALFQDNTIFKKLGLVIIDEQHKFGVNQRKLLSDKGGNNCDVLLMTATPIPRTLTMTLYGDMDLSIIREKPKSRKPIKTYSKLESKIDDVIKFIKKEIKSGNQIFWVCPLIEESKKLDHSSAVKKFEYLEKLFPNQVSLLHGKTDLNDKEIILDNFLKNKFQILVSTTIIEVGIDFPNANVIIIENANKFGLSQLHQLRGRVGRGSKDSTCILMFKSNLSENAKKRINILKESNDGFYISEEDMKIRGFGDILGFKQSGIKNFKLADPVHNSDLFLLAEKEIRRIENQNENISKFKPLIKLYDRADIINDIA